LSQDQLQAFYDGWLEPQPDVDVVPVVPRPANRFEACVRYFPRFFRGGRILELGAGSTLLSRSLLRAGVPAESIVLGEYSPERMRHIESTIDDPRLSVRHLDAEDLPADLGQFDAILMVAVIEHLVDPMAAMARIRHLLRPGGYVWINTPNIAKWTRRLKLLLGRFPSTAAWDEGLITYSRAPARLLDEGHLHYFTFRSLTRMLIDRCGFSRVVPVPHCESPRISLALEDPLARLWPTMFSEVSVAAYG
jgi:SAM-dependent methyltransferase